MTDQAVYHCTYTASGGEIDVDEVSLLIRLDETQKSIVNKDSVGPIEITDMKIESVWQNPEPEAIFIEGEVEVASPIIAEQVQADTLVVTNFVVARPPTPTTHIFDDDFSKFFVHQMNKER